MMSSRDSALIDLLLTSRGVVGDARERFLQPDFARDTHDPFLLADMDAAVSRVLNAVAKKERVAVYADFDCDGIPAAVVMHDFFKKVGHEHFEIYIPHRHNEGHGFHISAIDELAKREASLIITVDVGITAFEAAAHAHSLGIDVIITDHHELRDGNIPLAHAVINPKRDPYPFKDLCGTAVAFKLVQATLARGREQGIFKTSTIPEGWEKWLLDMVGIATVADMVPLVEENRTLAYFGLTVLRKSPRPGIHALCRKLRMQQRTLSEDDIGFSIAPRMNAASRMDCPELAFRLLTATDAGEAEHIADELERLNTKRKGTVAALVKEAKRAALKRVSDSPVIVLGNPLWKPALLGLAANSLVEEHGGVVCLWGRDGSGALKGSCRSDGSVNVVEMFKAAHVESALEESGGHAMAGGFSVTHDQVHRLQEVFSRAAEEAHMGTAHAASAYDTELEVQQIEPSLWKSLTLLAPFGIGNPKPLFRFSALMVREVRAFGKEKSHTEIMMDGGARTLRGFDFFRTPEDFKVLPRVGAHIDVIATIEWDSYRNNLALRLVDTAASSR